VRRDGVGGAVASLAVAGVGLWGGASVLRVWGVSTGRDGVLWMQWEASDADSAGLDDYDAAVCEVTLDCLEIREYCRSGTSPGDGEWELALANGLRGVAHRLADVLSF
jgi:hypothetical protein